MEHTANLSAHVLHALVCWPAHPYNSTHLRSSSLAPSVAFWRAASMASGQPHFLCAAERQSSSLYLHSGEEAGWTSWHLAGTQKNAARHIYTTRRNSQHGRLRIPAHRGAKEKWVSCWVVSKA